MMQDANENVEFPFVLMVHQLGNSIIGDRVSSIDMENGIEQYISIFSQDRQTESWKSSNLHRRLRLCRGCAQIS